jgi:hypothetical protein
MTQSKPSWRVPGAPSHELTRSTAAHRVGALAARSELLMAHYEYRVPMTLPSWWCPEGRPDLGEPPTWAAGVLPESKYQGFRHDRLVGSFHPSHRAKWTAHELCHGLVGFAWRPDASTLFHALAARLAEALPVALWYFFDEANGARCSVHVGRGPLSGPTCLACESLGRGGAVDIGDAERWWRDGQAWLSEELAAIRDSVRLGRPIGNPHPSIDLSSDGLAYAAAQAPRLSDPAFARYVELFFQQGQGWFSSLEGLEARVLEVASHLCGEGTAEPLLGGRWRWIAQDLGMRLVTVWVETDGDMSSEIERLLVQLSTAPSEVSVGEVIRGYERLHADWFLPEPDEVFAVGYPLPHGYGCSLRQATEGLRTACPKALDALGAHSADVLAQFVQQDAPERWERTALGRRFAVYMDGTVHSAAADQARFEAAVTYVSPADPIAATLGCAARDGDSIRVAQGVEVIRVSHAVTEAEPTPLEPPLTWALWQGADADVRLLEVSDAAAELIRAGGGREHSLAQLALDEEEAARLCAHGVLVPVRWSLDILPDDRL